MKLFKIKQFALTTAALMLCGCFISAPVAESITLSSVEVNSVPVYSSSVNSTLVSSAPSVTADDLGIPTSLTDRSFYTAETRQKMKENGLYYQEVESLRQYKFSLYDMLVLSPDQRQAYAFCGKYLTENWNVLPLPEILYPAITGLPEKTTPSGQEEYLIPAVTRFGSSDLGRPLYSVTLTPKSEYSQTVMLTFAIHGFEGLSDYDGGILTEYACQLSSFYSQNPGYLKNTRLILIPMLNPDGVFASTRKQSQGIDINRDFLENRFKAEETKAMKALLETKKPDILIDFQGWFNETYGSTRLAEIFDRQMKLPQKDTFVGKTQGYLAGYANGLGAETLLVELGGIRRSNVPKIILALNEIMK